MARHKTGEDFIRKRPANMEPWRINFNHSEQSAKADTYIFNLYRDGLITIEDACWHIAKNNFIDSVSHYQFLVNYAKSGFDSAADNISHLKAVK